MSASCKLCYLGQFAPNRKDDARSTNLKLVRLTIQMCAHVVTNLLQSWGAGL